MSGKKLWEPDEIILTNKKKGDKSTVLFRYLGSGEVAKDKNGKFKIYLGCWCHDYIWRPAKKELTLMIKKKKSTEVVKSVAVVTLEDDQEVQTLLKIRYE